MLLKLCSRRERRFIAIGYALLNALALFTPNAFAETDVNPVPIPGWTHETTLSRDSPQKHGIILPGNVVGYSSPVIAEIDGDPGNGKEVAVASSNGTVTVIGADGSVRWSKSVPSSGCDSSSTNRLHSSPAVGTLFGDGVPYVVVGYGALISKTCDGGVVAFRGVDGAQRWNFSIKRFSKQQRYGTRSYAVFSSPALADVDGDGTMEIGFGSFDRNVFLLNANGKPRFYYNAADTVWSSPAFANVDSDPKLEMIIGTDISANKALRPPTFDGGFLYAFKTARRKSKRISFRDTSAYVWQSHVNQVLYSSPVIADVLPDNPGQEVIIGSGCFFPQNSNAKRGAWVKVFDLRTGTELTTLNAPACFSSNPAVGDIDGDGLLEVVATVNGHTSIGGDGSGRLVAWKATNPEPLWSIVPRERGRNDDYLGFFMSPVIADVDGNGSLEIAISTGSSVGIYAGADGAALTCEATSCEDQPLTLFAWAKLKSTPAIGDVNNDGILDIVAAGGHDFNGSSGMLYGWTNLSSELASAPGPHPAFSAPFPQYRGDAQHTGVAE